MIILYNLLDDYIENIAIWVIIYLIGECVCYKYMSVCECPHLYIQVEATGKGPRPCSIAVYLIPLRQGLSLN